MDDFVDKGTCEKLHKYDEKEHEQFREGIMACANSVNELAKVTNGKLDKVHDRIDDVHSRVNELTTDTNAKFQALSNKTIVILIGIVLTLLSVPATLIWNHTIAQAKAGVDKASYSSLDQKMNVISDQLIKNGKLSEDNQKALFYIKKKYRIKVDE